MEKETVDLRDLILMIKEQKQVNANFSLEFDCVIETDNITPLIKVINYAINYINQLVGRSLSRLQFGTMCALYIAQTL